MATATTEPRVEERRDEARARLRAELSEHAPATVAEAVAGLDRLAALDEEAWTRTRDAVSRRFDALLRVHKSLGRLRECSTPDELIDAAPREACAACGFNRVMISRVRGSMWVPQVLHIEPGADPDGGEAFKAYVEQAEIPLAHLLVETELVRRRLPTIITDPPSDNRTFKEIVRVARSPSYVAAPIMPTGRVIGFFHADRFGPDQPPVTEADRDTLFLFAEHFGLLFERAVLVARLESQREQLRRALADAAETIDRMCEADIELALHEPVTPPERPHTGGSRRPSRLDGLLTPREREVLDLMARGATNTAVADQLVISEGTVKSHVKHILRKLRVSNRAEAVSRYLHMAQRERA